MLGFQSLTVNCSPMVDIIKKLLCLYVCLYIYIVIFILKYLYENKEYIMKIFINNITLSNNKLQILS